MHQKNQAFFLRMYRWYLPSFMSVSTHVRWILTTTTLQQFVFSLLAPSHRHSDGLVFASAIAVNAENMYWTCKLRVRVCVCCLRVGCVLGRHRLMLVIIRRERYGLGMSSTHNTNTVSTNLSMAKRESGDDRKKIDGDRVAV
jgi:hypothetical protein